jgi:hypothetical protein
MKDLEGAAQEVYAVERAPGLLVERLPPDAKRRELVHTLHGSVRFAVLWFATHGTQAGVWLNEEDCLPGDDLIALVRGSGVRGVVLNTCESAGLAEALHDATGVDVVCTVAQVADSTAFQTGVLFAQALGESGDFREAFEVARPGGSPAFRYVPEYRETLAMAVDRHTFSSEELRAIYDAINDIRQRLSVVEIELRYVRNDLDRRKGDLRDPSQWWIVGLGFAIAAALFLLLYLVMLRQV